MTNDFKAEKRVATILFCDIRNFTNLFDDEDPLKAVHFANTVLAELGEEVEKQGGKVDRFTGDGFLAHFGIANDTANHVGDACEAALRMRGALQNINAARYLDVQQVVTAGIGIHTGTVAVGEISTNHIKQTTVLGDVVNTTARIEQLTKYFSVDVLLSEQSYKRVKKEFQFKKMPPKKIKGKRKEVTTWWLLPMNDMND
ncbi:adenylate/guanylate cyclase domain-containing protein [Fodinibius halophilus]|uniref:Adenylate/guanylate cyclase domain-containing protein n=1 Tax=Fodinibius halophilus TaxID=1736908 RepID=A0A6M1T214_9BACT|nr:adenylate/guanylate cyclase domain-containing protein [Fodinibius halophilus]NGP87255.1 adenylate/guanylate cyclase domain-containing protein [Fodinibius halophilus]